MRAIRRTYDGSRASAIELGNRYGMTAGNVERIARRASWKQLPAEPGEYVSAAPATPEPPGGYKPRRKVDDDTVLAIRREFGRTPAKTLAERHGTSVQTIRDIGNRRTRKDVSPPAAGSGPQQPEEASGPGPDPEGRRAPRRRRSLPGRLQDVEDTDLSERQVREIPPVREDRGPHERNRREAGRRVRRAARDDRRRPRAPRMEQPSAPRRRVRPARRVRMERTHPLS